MHKTQDRQRTKNTTKADDNTGKMQIIWLMITMLPKRRKNASQMQKQERKKKRFTEEGRLSSLLSTKEFLLYLFASSWGQQFRACNRIKKYSKQQFTWRHVGKWIETHSLVTQKNNTSASNLLQISRLLEKTHNWSFGILEIIATNWCYEYVHKLTYTLNVVQIRTF